jgi:hypothetical protein
MTPTTTTRPLAAAVAALADAIANYTPAVDANTMTITYRGTSYDIATRGPVDHDDPHARYVVGCDHGYVYVDPHTGHGDLSDATDAAPMSWVDAVGVATTGVIACITAGVDPGTTWIDAAPIGARRTY